MMIATFHGDADQSIRYELAVSTLARQWAGLVRQFQAVRPALSQVPKWNSHLGYPSSYRKVPAYWTDLERLAGRLGLSAPAQPDPDWLNHAHAVFVERWRNHPQQRWWLELNNAIHWHEHHLQGRGPVDMLDLNRIHYQAMPLPQDAKASLERIQDGGLYLAYAQIGRWWDEVWRARDFGVRLDHHMQQSIWNSSCCLAHHGLACDESGERAFWDSRDDWGCRWEDRQIGFYRIGTRLDDVPQDWELGQIRGITLAPVGDA